MSGGVAGAVAAALLGLAARGLGAGALLLGVVVGLAELVGDRADRLGVVADRVGEVADVAAALRHGVVVGADARGVADRPAAPLEDVGRRRVEVHVRDAPPVADLRPQRRDLGHLLLPPLPVGRRERLAAGG